MTPNPSKPSSAFSQLDVERGISMLGSPEALKMILNTALLSLSDDVPAIGRELAAGDVRAAGRRLHGIKGYLPIFGSETLVANVLRLEQMSKSQPADVLAVEYAALGPAIQGLLGDIQAYVNRAD
jgi:HPt (histidine-containing phosphotransfer) domain-containing protein